MSYESIKDEIASIEDRVDHWLEVLNSIDDGIDRLLDEREDVQHTLDELAELADTKEAELGQDIHRAG